MSHAAARTDSRGSFDYQSLVENCTYADILAVYGMSSGLVDENTINGAQP